MNTAQSLLLSVLQISGFAWCGFSCKKASGIPEPADLKAKVIVSGHTSTAQVIDIVNIGKQIPYTYARRPLTNVDEFTGYISKHFALRTDYPEARARFWLELLELAYPHYVEAFGAPPDMAHRRIPCAYGKSKQSTAAIMKSDGFERGPGGGGEAMYYNAVAYSYPCGNEHHDRYILMHECAHAFQYAASGVTHGTPGWYHEGMADGLTNYSYDPQKKQLTVFLLNRWGRHNWQAEGLRAHQKNPRWPGGNRGQNVLTVNFFMSDPLRLQKFRVYRDEMFRISPSGEEINSESTRLLNEIYGPGEVLTRDYYAWVAKIRQVFKRVEGPWRPDDSDFALSDTQSANLHRLVMDLPPGKPLGDVYRFDRIGPKPTPLIGPVHCGTAEPAVGCLLDFTAAPTSHSLAGIGLGVITDVEILPFPEDMLYADKAATRKGINVAVSRLGRVVNEGKKSEDVANGEIIGKSVEPHIGLGLEGSPTRDLKENFIVEWDGWLRIHKKGVYRFATRSDDGSWLWINNQPVIDNGGYHGLVTGTGKVTLDAGVHRLRTRFYQGGGGFGLEAGLAKSNQEPGSLRVLIAAGHSLVIEGETLGISHRSLALPDDVVQAMIAGGHRVGITTTIAREKLRIELRTENEPTEKPVFRTSVPLTPAQRKRLLTNPIALLARQVAGKLTPYLDAHHPYFNLTQPAPPNTLRNPADNAFARVVKACWRLGSDAPRSLIKMRDALNDAVMKGRQAQRASLKRFHDNLKIIGRDIAKTGREKSNAALVDLSGLTLDLEHRSYPSHEIVATVRNPAAKPVRGSLLVSVVRTDGTSEVCLTRKITVSSRGEIQVAGALGARAGEENGQVVTTADFNWSGQALLLRAETSVRPNPWLSMRFDPTYEITDRGVVGRVIFTGPIQEQAAGTVTFRVEPADSVATAQVTKDVTVKASETQKISASFNWKDKRVPISVHARASLLLINERVWLEDSLKIE